MSGSSETLGQEIVIVPCVAKEGEDDARSVSVMHHLWNTTRGSQSGQTLLLEATACSTWAVWKS